MNFVTKKSFQKIGKSPCGLLLKRTLAGGPDTLKTAVYDDHQELGGKLVDFAGYWLPLQYPAGVKQECLHTRSDASLFDVSHMGQVTITGGDAVKFVESVVVGDIEALEPGQATLSLITNEKGGIIDDTVVARGENGTVEMVINGACKHKDLKHMHELLSASSFDAQINHLETLSLFALQGPKAAGYVQSLVPSSMDISKMAFMTSAKTQVGGIDVSLTRCGYTGEDGFELSVDNSKASDLMKLLLKDPVLAPAGLGARDTLRVEAGLCLYGIDITENTGPVEAGLLWTIGKRRRAEKGFTGADIIVDSIKNKPPRKRVGMVIHGPPARAHVELYAEDNKEKPIGEITSGTFSPVLGKPVAMGYVNKEFSKSNTKILAKVRNKFVPATVSKMPFVPANYYRVPES